MSAKLKLKPVAEQIIVITGATSGHGLATAQMAAEAGGRELLYCGTTRFDLMGRKTKGGMQGRGNLVSPTRLRPLMGVDIRFVASGCGELPPPPPPRSRCPS